MAELHVGVNPSGAVAGSATASGAIQGMKGSVVATEGAFARLQKAMFSLKGAAVIGVGLGIAAAFSSAVSESTSLDVALSGVAAVSGATSKQMGALEQQARDLGATTQFSATQAAEAQEFLAKAGFTVQETMDAVSSTLELAAAGTLDLGRAADISSNVLSAFNMEASELNIVVDVMAATASSANTSVEQMGNAMEFVGPVANAMGVSIQETAAGIGVLSNAGLQAEKAGTGLRRVLTELASPSDSLKEKMGGLTLEADGLTAVMKKIGEDGLTASEALEIFGQRGGPAFAVMQSGTADLEKLAESLQDVNGVAGEIAAKKLDNLAGDWKQFNSALSELQITVGKDGGLVSGLRSLVQTITDLIRSDVASSIAANLVPAIVALGQGLLALGAARFVGPLLIGIGRSAAGAVSGVTALNAALVTAQAQTALTRGAISLFTRGLALVGGPGGAAVLASLAIYKLASAETELDKVTKDSVEAQNDLKESIDKTGEASLGLVLAAKQAQVELLKQLKTSRDMSVVTQRMGTGFDGVTKESEKLNKEIEKGEQELRALENQLGTSTVALEAFGGAGDRVNVAMGRMAKGINDAEEKLFSYKEEQEEELEILRLRVEKGDRAADIQQIMNDAYNDGIFITKEYAESIYDEQKALQAQLKAQNDSTEAIKEGTLETGLLSFALEGLSEAYDTATKNTKDFQQELDNEIAVLKARVQGGEEAAEVEKLWQKAQEDGINISKEKIAQHVADKKALQDYVDETQKQSEQWVKIWDNAVESMQSSFTETIYGALWEDGISSFEDFGNAILDIWKRAIAEMVSAWLTSGMVGILKGDGMGGFDLGSLFSIGGGDGGGIFEAASFANAAKKAATVFSSVFGSQVTSGVSQAGAKAILSSQAAYTGAAQTAGTAAGSSFAASLGVAGTAALAVVGPMVAGKLIDSFLGNTFRAKAAEQFDGMSAMVENFAVGASEDFTFAAGETLGFLEQVANQNDITFGKISENVTAFKNLTAAELTALITQSNVQFSAMQVKGAQVFSSLGISAEQMGVMLQDGVIDTTERAALKMEGLGKSIENPKTGMTELGDLGVDEMDRIMEAVQNGQLRFEALTNDGIKFTKSELEILGDAGLAVMGNLIDRADGTKRSFGDVGNKVIDVKSELNRMGSSGNKSFGDVATAAKNAGSEIEGSITTGVNNATGAVRSFGSTAVSEFKRAREEAASLEHKLSGGSVDTAAQKAEAAVRALGKAGVDALGGAEAAATRLESAISGMSTNVESLGRKMGIIPLDFSEQLKALKELQKEYNLTGQETAKIWKEITSNLPTHKLGVNRGDLFDLFFGGSNDGGGGMGSGDRFNWPSGPGGGFGMAKGGIVSGPKSGYPVTLHGIEAVIPLKNSNSKTNISDDIITKQLIDDERRRADRREKDRKANEVNTLLELKAIKEALKQDRDKQKVNVVIEGDENGLKKFIRVESDAQIVERNRSRLRDTERGIV